MKKSIFMKGIDIILPPRCIVSGEIVSAQGMLSPAAWQELRFISAPFCALCGMPFEFDSAVGVEDGAHCAVCLDDPPPFARARAALVYDDSSRGIILKFKHADHLHAVPTLVPMMMRMAADMIVDADLIVPVPLHRWRLLRRRYNQAALLAIGLARTAEKRCLPDALIRTRSTPPQGHRRAKDRAANVRRAFAVNPRHDMRGLKVLLIDDVYTTGSTLRECTKTLLDAGAMRVDVLTIARVLKG